MRRSTIAIITIILMVLTFTIAWVASDYTQYSNPIFVQNGKAMIHTTSGIVSYENYAENGANVITYKPSAITTKATDNTPISLPDTSAPHGDHTCDMGSYTVTTDKACDQL